MQTGYRYQGVALGMVRGVDRYGRRIVWARHPMWTLRRAGLEGHGGNPTLESWPAIRHAEGIALTPNIRLYNSTTTHGGGTRCVEDEA
jgi:hypothetical protein